MKRTWKKIIAVVMTLIMALSVCSVAASAASEKLHSSKRTVKTIAFLGDSIAAGYCVEGGADSLSAQLDVHTGELVEGSYPQLVSKAVKATNAYNLSREAWTIYDWLRVLDPDYEDWINQPENWQERWYSECGMSMLMFTEHDDYENIRENSQKYIANADVITIELGNNETGTNASMSYFYQTLYYMFGMAITPAMIYAEDGEFIFPTSIPQIIQMVGGYENYLTLLDENVEKFKEAYDMLVKRILELNPDAEIYTVGMYNIFRDQDPQGDNIQQFLAASSDEVNTEVCDYFRSGSKYAKKTTFVDITETEYYASESIYSVGYYMHFVTRCHPTKAGHMHIANKIIEAINGNNTVDIPVIKKGSDGWGYYNVHGNLVTYYNGLGQKSNGTVYYLKEGKVNSSYSGVITYKSKQYLISKGKLRSNFSGTYRSKNYVYTIKNGVVTKRVKR